MDWQHSAALGQTLGENQPEEEEGQGEGEEQGEGQGQGEGPKEEGLLRWKIWGVKEGEEAKKKSRQADDRTGKKQQMKTMRR